MTRNYTSTKGKETIENVAKLASQGKTKHEIATKLRRAYDYISILVRENNIAIQNKSIDYSGLDDLILDGLTQAEMRNKTGHSYKAISNYISSNNFQDIYKEAKQLRKRENPKNEKLIKILGMLNNPNQYFTETEVAEELHKTYQAVNKMLNCYGFKKAFEKKRKSRDKNLKKENSEKSKIIIPFLHQYLKKRINELSWPEQKAFEYISSTKQNHTGSYQSYSFETLSNLFEIYKQSKDSGEKISFKEIGERLRIDTMGVRRVLKSVGEKSLYWENKYTPRISQAEKSAIQRGLETVFSLFDLGYFLNRPGVGTSKKVNETKRIGARSCSITYSYASQVYEAQDLGFNKDEIFSLLGKRIESVSLAIKRRPELEKDLISSLRKIYNDDSIDKPYVNVQERVAELRGK